MNRNSAFDNKTYVNSKTICCACLECWFRFFTVLPWSKPFSVHSPWRTKCSSVSLQPFSPDKQQFVVNANHLMKAIHPQIIWGKKNYQHLPGLDILVFKYPLEKLKQVNVNWKIKEPVRRLMMQFYFITGISHKYLYQ